MTYYGSCRTSKVCDAVFLNFLITILNADIKSISVFVFVPILNVQNVPWETAKQKERNTMIFEKLVALIAEQFNVDEDSITMDTSFVDDLNADSVDLMDLSVALEEEFGIEEMGDEDVSSIVTVGDVVHFLQSRLD